MVEAGYTVQVEVHTTLQVSSVLAVVGLLPPPPPLELELGELPYVLRVVKSAIACPVSDLQLAHRRHPVQWELVHQRH